MPRSLVLSGGGACADPWHPFAQTSARLADVLWSLGHQVEVTDFVADRVTDLSGFDLIVVNAASGPGAPAAAQHRCAQGLRAALDRGLAVLAVHTGVCTLLRLPEWEAVTGAAWVPGRSGHPKLGPAHVQVHPDRHPIVAGLAGFDLIDERYVGLRLTPGLVPLATHRHEGRQYPLVWARQVGRSRVVADTLGHDVQSYDSAAHRQLLSRAVQWLTGDPADPSSITA
jgi:type 1 glutamine amidotransferase